MYKLQSLKIKNIISFREQEYTFQNGKALLIVGRNETDPQQKGNGSGKSAFMESISIAFTGCSVRDVKTKELINRDSDFAEVELTLLNTQNKAEFKIWRKLFNNTKSAEYKAWINGKEQCDRYSDFNMFNSFIWETIGISKEDFFSFYFLTGDYTPFLLSSDATKKITINKFSGADKIDNALPLVEEDAEKVIAEIQSEEKLLTSNLAKQELLAEQLLEEENKVSEEAKNELIGLKELELESIKDDGSLQLAIHDAIEIHDAASKASIYQLHAIDKNLKPLINTVAEAGKAVTNFQFTQDYDLKFADIKDIKDNLEADVFEHKQQLPKVKEGFQSEIDAIIADETELKESLTEVEKDLKENEKFESEVNKKLQDTIVCPVCDHQFSLRDKLFNPTEAKAKLPEVQQNIADYKELILEIKKQLNTDIQESKQEVNRKILKAQEGIKSEIEALNAQLVSLGHEELTLKQKYQEEVSNKQQLASKVTQAKQQLRNKEQEEQNMLQSLKNEFIKAENLLKKAEQDLQSHLEQITALEKQIEKLKNQELDRSKINKIEADINTLILSEEKIKERLESKRKEKENIDSWSINFKNFKSHVANKSLSNIESYTNLFLQNMGSDLSIKLEGYKLLASKKIKEQITTHVLRSGFEEGSFGSFSGGEKGRINLSNVIGMAELINISSPTGGLDFLLIDECLDQVDLLGIESIITSLQPIGKTVLIISQHTEINSLSEYTLTIQKKNKVSQILIN